MKKKQGISLIVLVITIIVMIILAASVVITLSNTGVINRASQAVDLTNESAVQDLAALTWADAYMDNKRGTELVNEVTTKLGEQGVTADKWNITVTDTGVSVTAKKENPVIYGATFSDGVTLTWEELMLTENGTKYGYSASGIKEDSIGGYAFYLCSQLVSINIPETVTSIGGCAFQTCSGITSIGGSDSEASIKIPNSITNIAYMAFAGCGNLTSVDIPDGITTISTYAFTGCSNISTLKIPKSVTNINSFSFERCTGITKVEYAGSKTEWNAITKGTPWSSTVEIICTDGTITM